MDRVIACILVLIAAFIIQYLWQYYRTMTDEDGVAVAVDVAEPVTHRDQPQVLSLQVFNSLGVEVYKMIYSVLRSIDCYPNMHVSCCRRHELYRKL